MKKRTIRVAVCVHQTPLVLCNECKGPQQDAERRADKRRAIAKAEAAVVDAAMERHDAEGATERDGYQRWASAEIACRRACAELAKLLKGEGR